MDLGAGRNRLGGSALALAWGQVGDVVPDLDEPAGWPSSSMSSRLPGRRRAARLSRSLRWRACSSRSSKWRLPVMRPRVDVARWARIRWPCCSARSWARVIQVRAADVAAVVQRFRRGGLGRCRPRHWPRRARATPMRIAQGGKECFRASRVDLHRAWAELSYTMQGLRDNPACAREEYDAILDADAPGLSASLTYQPSKTSPRRSSPRARGRAWPSCASRG